MNHNKVKTGHWELAVCLVVPPVVIIVMLLCGFVYAQKQERLLTQRSSLLSLIPGLEQTKRMAQQVLKHLVHVQDRKVTIDSIQKAVAERFQVKPAQLREKSNTKKVVYPRQVAMYLIKELTDASLPEIGRAFGGKHHTTVLHSINKIEQSRQNDPDLNRLLHSLMDSLQ